MSVDGEMVPRDVTICNNTGNFWAREKEGIHHPRETPEENSSEYDDSSLHEVHFIHS